MMGMFLRAENTDRKDERMDQAGSQPRPDKPDRADSAERSPGPPAKDAPPRREPARQPSPKDPPPPAPGTREPAHPVVIRYDGAPSSPNALAYAARPASRPGQPPPLLYLVPYRGFCGPLNL